MHILAGEGDRGPALGPRVEGRQILLKMGPSLPPHQSISQGLPALELQIKAQRGGGGSGKGTWGTTTSACSSQGDLDHSGWCWGGKGDPSTRALKMSGSNFALDPHRV